MVSRTNIFHWLLVAGVSALYVFALWIYPYSFNYELSIHWHNSFLFFSAALYIIFLAGVIAGRLYKKLTSVSKIILVVPAGLFLVLCLFPSLFSFSNEHLCVMISLLMSGIVMYYLQVAGIRLVLVIIFLIIYFIQLGIGLWQYSGSYQVTGTLRNTGVYTCYMIVHLPLLLHFLRWLKLNKYAHMPVQGIFLFLVIINLALSYLNFSRTAIIACIVVIILLYSQRLLQSIRQIPGAIRKPALAAVLVLVVAGAVATGSHIFNGKRLSAMGRIMKWEIARAHLADDVFFGTGPGRFTFYYPQWQAAYFRETTIPPADYYMSAGESYILFNEYLQLYLETGLIGMLAFLSAAILFFRSPSKGNDLAKYSKVMAAGILSCGFTSYPFHIIPLLMLLQFCFVTVLHNCNSGKIKFVEHAQKMRPVMWVALMVLLVAGYFSFCRMRAVEQWKAVKNNYSLSRQKMLSIYRALHTQLKDDGKFLTDYASFLMQEAGNCGSAIPLLENSKQYFICTETFYAAAAAYKCLGKYDRAIEQYQFISSYIPVLFRPRYEMALLYKEAGNMPKALNLARTIVDMPVKIPSRQIDQMKAEMKQWLLNAPG